ncbi:cytochrome-b5 reductase [Malassezia sp. CBS 17886]|nr:cytochrome-b5 reductase [Malassezia sp. CBS 17886]
MSIARGAARMRAPRATQRHAVWAALALGAAAVGCGAYAASVRASAVSRFTDVALTTSDALQRDRAHRFDPHDPVVHRHLQLRSDTAWSIPSSGVDARARMSIFSFYAKDPEIQVERAYTPLAMCARGEPGVLDLIVKRYSDGEVSRYLHHLRTGTSVAIRGPECTWRLPDDTAMPTEVVMIVAGTGITAAYQLLSNVFGSRQHAPADAPHFTVLYAAPSVDAFVLLPELASLKQRFSAHVDLGLWAERVPHGGRAVFAGVLSPPLDAELLVGEAAPRWCRWLSPGRPPTTYELRWGSGSPSESVHVTPGRMHEAQLASWIGSGDKAGRGIPARGAVDNALSRTSGQLDQAPSRIVLVCGPDGYVVNARGAHARFIAAVAGAKGWDAVSQGALGGILARLGYTSAQVVKL